MPYIKKVDRLKFKKTLEHILPPHTAGELNYCLSCICQLYLLYAGESYQTHNDIMGALSGVQQEWYRRKVAPYEEKKIKENGDIF